MNRSHSAQECPRELVSGLASAMQECAIEQHSAERPISFLRFLEILDGNLLCEAQKSATPALFDNVDPGSSPVYDLLEKMRSRVQNNEHGSIISEAFSAGAEALNQTNLVAGRWKLDKLLGCGAFGFVFEAYDVRTGERVAIKMDQELVSNSTLTCEYEVYCRLGELQPNNSDWPKCFHYEHAPFGHVLVMQKMGLSVRDVQLEQRNKRLSLKSVLQIGIQMVRRLEQLHKVGYVHADVKPGNMLVGAEDPSKIFLVDFGVSMKYKRSTEQSNTIASNKACRGTLAYASLIVHAGFLATPLSDLESLGYSLVDLHQGGLPWRAPNDMPGALVEGWVSTMKRRIPFRVLCEGMGKGMSFFFAHVASCKYSDEPNYDLLCKYLRRELKRRNLNEDGKFEWTQ